MSDKKDKKQPIGNGIGLSKSFVDQWLPKFGEGDLAIFEMYPAPKTNPANPRGGKIATARKNIPNQYRVKDTVTGETVDMYAIKQVIPPAPGQTNPQTIFEDWELSKMTNDGRIILSGSNPGNYEKFIFLYFHQRNIANKGFPYHIPVPNGSKYLFKYIDKETKAGKSVADMKMKNRAEGLVLQMEVDKMKEMSMEVLRARIPGFEYHTYFEQQQLRENLLKVAGSNPKVILQFDEQLDMDLRVLVQEAIDKKIFTQNNALKRIQWHDGSIVCYMGSYSDMKTCLVYHLKEDTRKSEDDLHRMAEELKGEVRNVKNPETVVDQTEYTDEEDEAIRAEWQELFGKKPHHMKKTVNLIKEIEEKKKELELASE